MNIFICEDMIAQLNFISTTVTNAITIENYDMKIILKTNNPYDIINALQYNCQTSIYFLDVNLNSTINGIDLAKKIREYDSNGYIIFISTHEEYMSTIVKTRTEIFDFIIKADMQNVQKEIIENLKLINNISCNALSSRFSIKINDKLIFEDFHKIIYFRTSEEAHKIIMCSVYETFTFRESLKNIVNKLNDNFIQIGSYAIVNKSFIDNVDFVLWRINMKNDTYFEIPFRKRNYIKNLLYCK